MLDWIHLGSHELYLVRELREVLDGRRSETLLCPSGRDVGHSCTIVGFAEHGGFEVEMNARMLQRGGLNIIPM